MIVNISLMVKLIINQSVLIKRKKVNDNILDILEYKFNL